MHILSPLKADNYSWTCICKICFSPYILSPLKVDNYSWTCICKTCFSPFNIVTSHRNTETSLNYWPLSAAI